MFIYHSILQGFAYFVLEREIPWCVFFGYEVEKLHIGRICEFTNYHQIGKQSEIAKYSSAVEKHN